MIEIFFRLKFSDKKTINVKGRLASLTKVLVCFSKVLPDLNYDFFKY